MKMLFSFIIYNIIYDGTCTYIQENITQNVIFLNYLKKKILIVIWLVFCERKKII